MALPVCEGWINEVHSHLSLNVKLIKGLIKNPVELVAVCKFQKIYAEVKRSQLQPTTHATGHAKLTRK
jgi:hypothetical protein